MAGSNNVAECNSDFYLAFSTGDIDLMASLWSTTEESTCIHPGGGVIIGHQDILISWQNVLANPPDVRFFEIARNSCREFSYFTCIENLGYAKTIATNIYKQEEDGWKIIHHHGAPLYEKVNTEAVRLNSIH